jgi:hypothetical protein
MGDGGTAAEEYAVGVAITFLHCSSVISAGSPLSWTPALFTSTSSRPKRFTVDAIMFLTARGSETSTTWASCGRVRVRRRPCPAPRAGDRRGPPLRLRLRSDAPSLRLSGCRACDDHDLALKRSFISQILIVPVQIFAVAEPERPRRHGRGRGPRLRTCRRPRPWFLALSFPDLAGVGGSCLGFPRFGDIGCPLFLLAAPA